jgi:hypothetical protein
VAHICLWQVIKSDKVYIMDTVPGISLVRILLEI